MISLVFWDERKQPAENGPERWKKLGPSRAREVAMEFFWLCLFVAFCVGLTLVIFATPERP
jgi:hypothetical protein